MANIQPKRCVPASQELVLTQDPPWSLPNEPQVSQGHLTSQTDAGFKSPPRYTLQTSPQILGGNDNACHAERSHETLGSDKRPQREKK